MLVKNMFVPKCKTFGCPPIPPPTLKMKPLSALFRVSNKQAKAKAANGKLQMKNYVG
jgi:hypothetical protein